MPFQGGGVQGIPIWVYPVANTSGATATVTTVTITGTATATATHTFIIAGREGLDSQSYSVSIAATDTSAAIVAKYVAAINAVYGSPVIASAGTGTVILTSKWVGISSIFAFDVDTNLNDAGVTYSSATTAGTLTGDVAPALAEFGNDWNTLVINPYGADATVLNLLETVNGIPDPTTPTGRYSATIFKPFLSFFSKESTDPITDLGTDLATRANQVTNVYCPAPNVSLLPCEVAANVCSLVAQIAQNSPNLDVNDEAYPDVIVSGVIGNYSNYSYRDAAVKAGLSTVDYIGGNLIIKDLVTTYNPSDEITPQFNYVRNLLLDFNVRYAYKLLEQTHVVNHTLVPDGTVVSAADCISPSQWIGILFSMFDDLANRGLIADADFAKASVTVGISSTNPNRFETFFRYQRTGIARICSTTAEAGFYYGN
jgi:phage tail sheath gpL-like